MQIISHRGWWKSSDEKNELIAFEREFQYCSNCLSESYRGGGWRLILEIIMALW
ncbi:hypothetical protein [uncultured Campylobacter sp.]|uniref:hypothetical protein n=1 Tax=uncultured Campylobacter sp. TaxID=218934 RepID=UPI00260E5B42|nr:hypothetical protein [uncultured Campylobacter sp.]